MQVEQIINRNQRIIPFLQHCLNLLFQKYHELRKSDKIEDFITHFIKNETVKLEDDIIESALKYFKDSTLEV